MRSDLTDEENMIKKWSNAGVHVLMGGAMTHFYL